MWRGKWEEDGVEGERGGEEKKVTETRESRGSDKSFREERKTVC